MTEQDCRSAGAAPHPTGAERHQEGPHLEPPKVYAWVASLATLALIVTAQLVPPGQDAVLRLLGVGTLALAAVFIFPPFLLLARHGGRGEGESYLQTRGLVDCGLYAVVRHPQYLGYILLAAGFALLSQHGMVLLLGAIAVTCFVLQSLAEERYCLAQLGEPYRRYLRRVPRFNVPLGIVHLLAQPEQGGRVWDPEDCGHQRGSGRSIIERNSEKE
jgi:protein-S-isoprenylcysteine O-methyltransferase Ste14